MSPDELTSTEFDFVIVGGGTAGLTVAARLSENPEWSVAVIEAGKDNTKDPLVYTPLLAMKMFDNPAFDWNFQTVPQKAADGTAIGWPRGKGLGGSSMINLQMVGNPSKQDLDNWVELGNPSWGWDDMQKYFRKFETFYPPSEKLAKELQVEYLDPKLRGDSGPIQVGHVDMEIDWLKRDLPTMAQKLGLPAPNDPRKGSALGGFNQLTAIDPKTKERSYAATGYWLPNKDRPNFSVVTEALAEKVLLEKNIDGEVRATGVSFTSGGKPYTIKVKKEVIVCGGTVQSPQILEASGIGKRELLHKHEIECLVDNPNVGENLQDHCNVFVSWETKPGVVTGDVVKDPAIAQQLMTAYLTARQGPLSGTVSATVYAPWHFAFQPSGSENAEQCIQTLSRTITPGSAVPPQKHLRIMERQLGDPTEAALQVIYIDSAVDIRDRNHCSRLYINELPFSGFSMLVCNTHPFSRGSVHIRSALTHDAPTVDPGYFTNDMDTEVLAHSVLRMIQAVETNNPIAANLADVGAPGSEKVWNRVFPTKPKTVEEAREYVKKAYSTVYHPIGTCQMAPESEGGVVDTSLRVYGTKGLRVVDASIMPLHVQGNIMSSVYAIAEKAADLIKETWGT
ncbi:alcohol oxidase [Eremomyces bilateralis CBS 781.70]|uniref:Alcohol oxidase n=1 Tax=Eremomyces bilateralis CBS 781.70 TaxID=1392243 RepID=A0A6G1FUZ2_9PEZI|nr:alcohol oxidase [Eremomyces bilateralis CBS 781.70]KAF1809715.1 alcohol oxidase [Eremomyces bilateralis CBS 781.70]